MSAGFDHMDISELKNRNILIGCSSKACAGATAELTVALTLATTRRLIEARDEVVQYVLVVLKHVLKTN